MTHRSNRNRPFERLFCGVLTVCFLCALPALGQEDPLVTSADPSSAEQETYDLDVLVGGDNFGKESEVHFLVSGTANPGGIHVKKVKQLGPKTLKVTVDVDADAVVDDFDIEVMSRGRTGKGVELFRVLEKTNPGGGVDTTPPSAPADFRVVEAKYGSVLFTFTMPADDGVEVSSGPVTRCEVGVKLAGSSGEPHWNEWKYEPPWGQPGEDQLMLVSRLDPDTLYEFVARCRDEVPNWSDEVSLLETTLPFVQDPAWTIEEVLVEFNGDLIGHAIDNSGNVFIAGPLGDPYYPSATRLVTGTRVSDGWEWGSEDLPGVARRLAIDPDEDRPALVAAEMKQLKRNRYESRLLYSFFDGAQWITELVAAASCRGLCGHKPRADLAFDSAGSPAVAWCELYGSEGMRLARREGAGAWSVQEVNGAYCDPHEGVRLVFDDLGDPAIAWVDLVSPEADGDQHTLRLSRWTAGPWPHYGDWSEEFVDSRQPGDVALIPTGLVFDSLRGDFTLVWDTGIRVSTCDRDAESGWQCDVSHPFGTRGAPGLSLDPAGDLFLALEGEASMDVVLARRPAGQTAWEIEPVDHPSTHGLSFYVAQGQSQPHLALDPANHHDPTLTWTWLEWVLGPGGEFANFHLYFAWKAQ